MNNTPAINTIISKYNETLLSTNVNDLDSLELEIGIRFSADSAQPLAMKYIYSKTLDKLKSISSSIEIIQNLDIFYTDNIRKTMIFSEGVNQKKDVIIRKQQLAKPFVISRDIKNIKDMKLKLSYEEKLTEKDIKGSVEFMKFKLRLRFILSEDKNYMAELDLVKVVKQESDLKNIKNAIFKKYNIDSITNALEFSLFDECRLEYEFINNEELNIEKVFEPINEMAIFNNRGVDVGNYQKYIFSLARQIISNNKNYLETFRFKSGLKKLLNNVIEMDSNLYYKQIQPRITTEEGFYITDKIDGKRSILMIKYMKSDLTNCNVALLNNNLTLLKEIKLHKNKKNDAIDYITLDCELLEENNKKELFVFDVITYNSSKYTSRSFSERLAVMPDAVNKATEILNVANVDINIQAKEFVLLTSNWKEELSKFYKKASNQKYEIDGIIFTPNDKSDYSKMTGYKWKPAEHSTIDFYIKKVPTEILNTSPELFKKEKSTKNKDDNCNYYVLFSGISRKDLESFNIKTMTHYDTIVGKIKDGGLMPIQFQTSDKPYNYIFRQCKEDTYDLDNKIGEFGWDGKQWILKRIRTDRDVELARGEYYGNYYKVAENIWYSINNPLAFDDLLKENNGMYFMADNVDVYKEQRNFNSYVKTVALQSIIEQVKLEGNSSPLLIDLAAGKGQDLARIANLGIKDSIFVDNDKSAIQELIRRKHSIKNFNMRVSTVHSDLNSDYKEVINNIENSYGKKLHNSVDIVVCNFAIHYIANNVDKLKNIIQLISYLLKTNGVFMFTCFDGMKVKKVCGENGWDANIEDSEVLKYSIRKINNSRIRLILPFSNGEYYEEDLLDIQLLKQTFNDNGFSTESLGSFINMIDLYKNKENLSNDDKIFSGLYSYNVYRKNIENGPSIIVKKNPYSIISKNLVSDVKEGGVADEPRENNNLSSLDNVPLNNIIVFVSTIIGTSENINSIAIKDIKYKLESFGYRDLDTNSKLRKKIYVLYEDNDKLYKFLEQKSKKNIVSVIIMEKDFLNIYEEYFKYLIKLPINNINIMNKCLVLNSIDFIKYKKEYSSITTNIFKQFNNDNSICYNV